MYLAPDEIQEIDGHLYPTTEVLRSVFVAHGRGLIKRDSRRPAPATMSFSTATISFRLTLDALKALYHGKHPFTTSKICKPAKPKLDPASSTLLAPGRAVIKRGAKYYPSQTYLKQIFIDRDDVLLWRPQYWARRRKIQVEGRVIMFIRGRNCSFSAQTLRNLYFLDRVHTPKNETQTNQSVHP